MRKSVENQKKLFVHCQSGQFNAPAVILLYLYLYEKMSVKTAMKFIHIKSQISLV